MSGWSEKRAVLQILIPSAAASLVVFGLWKLFRKREQVLYRSKNILVSEPSLTDLEEKYLLQAYRSTFISGGAGKFKKRLETEFARMCGCRFGVATANGTVAINLALCAAGLKEGDEVIVPSFTYVASVAAIVTAGGVPVMVDCDETVGLMDPAAVEAAITDKSKFIMAVHLYGHPVDMDRITDIAARRDIPLVARLGRMAAPLHRCLLVIEDAAEAHGATYKGRPVGSLGDLATFSFYANKVMTTGEGGIVVTNNPDLAKEMVFLRGHAMSSSKRFWHTDVGFNYRLSNLLCAVGVAQLERFEELFKGRMRVVEAYRKSLEGFGGIRINPSLDNCSPSPWLACVWLPTEHVDKRDAVCDDLEGSGIETRPFFYPVHVMPPYKKYRIVTGGKRTEGTVTDGVSACGFNIPTSAHLSDAEVEHICQTVKDVLARHCRLDTNGCQFAASNSGTRL